MVKNFDIEEFIKELNDNVTISGRGDISLKIKVCSECKPVSVKLERVFKYGKFEFKNVDSTVKLRL